MAAFRALDPDKKHHRTIIARRADSCRPHYVFVSRYRLFVIGSQHIAGIRVDEMHLRARQARQRLVFV
jgi:hypothetical protein